LDLVYVGNQYDRDDHFAKFFACAAPHLRHGVFGKWTRTNDWPAITFHGRVPFANVYPILRGATATPLLSPKRYRAAGQVTQRIFEAVLNGCFPLAPHDIKDIQSLLPEHLVVSEGADIPRMCARLGALRETPEYSAAILDCARRLAPFRASKQYDLFERIMASF
jgi:hypothetical protein